MFNVEDRGNVRWLTLDRPERKNAIPPEGWPELARVFREFEADGPRVLVVRGAGGDFCSGADLGDESKTGPAPGVIARFDGMRVVEEAARALHAITKPTVAAVDGVAVGAGMNLALGCDVVLASTRARFSEIFVRRGMTLDFGGTWLLPRIVGLQRAKELALSGRIVDGIEAARIGLALEAVAAEDLEARAGELADRFASGAPIGQMFVKVGLDRSWAMTFEEGLAFESQSQAICLSSRDVGEGVAAFLEKRPPRFEGR